jgi:hypothetical protein
MLLWRQGDWVIYKDYTSLVRRATMLEDLKVRDLIGKRESVYFVDADDTTDIAALKLKNFKVRTIGVL